MVFSEIQSYFLYMTVVVLSYILPCLDDHFSLKFLLKKRFKRTWTIILFFIMLAILMFRSCGADTLEYESIFLYKYTNADFDIAFHGLIGVVRRFTDNIIIWQGIMGSITLAAIFLAAENLKYYVDRKLFILYASVYLYFFALNYSRMIMSVGILILAFSFLVKGQNFKYVLLNILAGLIHYSSFAVMPVFLLFYFCKKHKKIVFFIGVIGAFLVRTRPDILGLFIVSDHYSPYFTQNFSDSGGIGTILVILPYFLLIYYFSDKCDEKIITLMYVLLIGNMAFGFLGYVVPVASRLARFTFVFPCIFIPAYLIRIKNLTNDLQTFMLNVFLLIWVMFVYIFIIQPTFNTIGILPYMCR